jgi:hypothetical protein
MKPAEILRLRLSAQRIATKAAALGPAGVVRHMLAMQAQDFGQALWAIGVRSPGAARSDVLAALERGEIVRSSPFRGTLMWVAPEDLKWMLGVTAERSIRSVAARQRQLELHEETLVAARRIAERLLPGNPSTREEFFAALNEKGIQTTGQRGYHIIWHLAQTGVLCWGPPKGAQQGLVLLDEWAKHPRDLGKEEALAELARRYFTSRGPATVKDFAWWAGITQADAKTGLAGAEGLAEVHDALWSGEAEAGHAPASLGSGVITLPGFDEYILGYQDRAHPLAAEHFERIVPGNNGIFLPMLVIRGRVVGTWKRDKAVMRPEFFGGQADVAKPEKAYARFMTN